MKQDIVKDLQAIKRRIWRIKVDKSGDVDRYTKSVQALSYAAASVDEIGRAHV